MTIEMTKKTTNSFQSFKNWNNLLKRNARKQAHP